MKNKSQNAIVNVLLYHRSIDNYGQELWRKRMEVIWSIISQTNSQSKFDGQLVNLVVSFYLKNIIYDYGGFHSNIDDKIIFIIFTELILNQEQVILLLKKIERDLVFAPHKFFFIFEKILEMIEKNITEKTNWNHKYLIEEYILNKKLKKKNVCDCPLCMGRCSSDMNIHQSMLKCENCGYLIINPNYKPFLGCH